MKPAQFTLAALVVATVSTSFAREPQDIEHLVYDLSRRAATIASGEAEGHLPPFEGAGYTGYGAAGHAGMCCEFPVSCCNDVWAGYCEEQRHCGLCGHAHEGLLCRLSCWKLRIGRQHGAACQTGFGRVDRCAASAAVPAEVIVSDAIIPEQVVRAPAPPPASCKPQARQCSRNSSHCRQCKTTMGCKGCKRR